MMIEQKRLVLIMVLINAFTTPLMLSAVNVALPALASDLKLNAVTLSWVPMIYLMASAMFVFIFGRLADLYGRKRIFLAGTLCVVISSILAALSSNAAELLTARFFQGVSAAMLYATQIAIISSIYPHTEKGKVIGLTVSMIYLGLSIGPLLGGFSIEQFGWRSSFLLHIPLAVIVLVIGNFFVHQDWHAEEKARLDLAGGLVYALAIAMFCLGVSQLPQQSAFVILTVSLLCLLIFIYMQYHTSKPLLDVRLFWNNRNFSFSCLASLIIYTATFANVVLISLYLQYLKALSPVIAGSMMMIQPITMAAFSPWAGSLSDRYQARWIASFGIVLIFIGLLSLAYLQQASHLMFIIISLFLTGMGFSFFSSPNVSAIIGSVDKQNYGSANAIVATMRIVGQLSSMVLVTMMFSLFVGDVGITPEQYDDLQTAIRSTFLLAALICLPGIWFSLGRGDTRQAVP